VIPQKDMPALYTKKNKKDKKRATEVVSDESSDEESELDTMDAADYARITNGGAFSPHDNVGGFSRSYFRRMACSDAEAVAEKLKLKRYCDAATDEISGDEEEPRGKLARKASMKARPKEGDRMPDTKCEMDGCEDCAVIVNSPCSCYKDFCATHLSDHYCDSPSKRKANYSSFEPSSSSKLMLVKRRLAVASPRSLSTQQVTPS